MDRLAYLIKSRAPWLFRPVAAIAHVVTTIRFGRRVRRATEQAEIHGTVSGASASIRALSIGDVSKLWEFLQGLPDEHLQFFRPHGFDVRSLRNVLRSATYLNYGLFVGDDLAAYALLKIAPTGSAYIGRLVSPAYLRLGLGKFLAQYLYWQASLAGLRARSTISPRNRASMASHRAVQNFKVVSRLPNDYLLIEFTVEDPQRPHLLAGSGSPPLLIAEQSSSRDRVC